MLQLTANASQSIEDLRPANLPDHRMLRVARDSRSRRGTVRLTFVARPRPGDLVGESQGIAVCVGEDLVERLDEMVLDRRDADGVFVCAPRRAERQEDAGAPRRAVAAMSR